MCHDMIMTLIDAGMLQPPPPSSAPLPLPSSNTTSKLFCCHSSPFRSNSRNALVFCLAFIVSARHRGMRTVPVFLTLVPRACASSTHFPPVLWSQRKGSISVSVPLYDAQQLSFAFSNADVGRGCEFQFSCIGCSLLHLHTPPATTMIDFQTGISKTSPSVCFLILSSYSF
jgi:hypothetical protein